MSHFLVNQIEKLTTVFFLLVFLLSSVGIAQAQVNPQINYQGKLANALGVTVPDGQYNVNFWLINSGVAATSTAVWSEARTGVNRVQVTNGLFSVMLGSVTSLSDIDFNLTLYLAVEVGGIGAAVWDGELLPRKIIGTVPTAFVANYAKTASSSLTLGGVASSSFLRSDEADNMTATSTVTLLSIVQNGIGKVLSLFSGATEVFTVLNNGNVGVGTSTPVSKLSVVGNTALNGDIEISGTVRATLLTPGRVVYSTTGSYLTDTANFVFDGTNLGVGTSSPSSRLTIDGDIFATGALRDSENLSGVNGYVLQTTGIGSHWVATSTLGISGGVSNFLGLTDTISSFNADRILYTSGSAVIDSADFTYNGTDLNLGVGKGLAINGVRMFSASSVLSSVAVGEGAMSSASGSYSVAVGSYSQEVSSGSNNTSIGFQSLNYNTTGGSNFAGGYNSLANNTEGGANTASGAYSLSSNIIGNNNSAFGFGSLGLNATGNSNTANGWYSLHDNTKGDGNTALGANAGYDINTATSTGSNTVIGYNTGRGIITGVNNTILGANVTGLSSTLSNNIIIADGTGNQRINVDSTGNVGIGTTTSSSKLTVAGDFFITGSFRDSLNSAGTNGHILQTTGSGVRWVATSTLGFSSTSFTNSAGLASILSDETGTGNAVFSANPILTGNLSAISASFTSNVTLTGSSANIVLGANFLSGDGGDEGVSVDSNGNVGIGTASPVSRLEIYGVGQTTAYLSNIGDKGSTLSLNSAGAAPGDGGAIAFGNIQSKSVGSVGFAAIKGLLTNGSFSTAGDLAFSTRNDPTASILTERMRIRGDGFVGIGTGAPAVQLTVVGDIRVGTSGANGCIQRFDGSTIAGTCSSDENLKTNIAALSSSTRSYIESITDLTPVTYSWNSIAEEVYKNHTGTKIIGLTAQDVEIVFPELVSVDDKGYRQVDFSSLTFYVMQALKEFYAEFTDLKNKVTGFANEFRTNRLCVGSVCVTENELQKLLDNSQTTSVPPTTVIEVPTVNEVVDEDTYVNESISDEVVAEKVSVEEIAEEVILEEVTLTEVIEPSE